MLVLNKKRLKEQVKLLKIEIVYFHVRKLNLKN